MKKIVKVMVAIIIIISLPLELISDIGSFVATFVRYKRMGLSTKFFSRYCRSNLYHYLLIDIDRIRNGRIRYF